jgi:hypothetical protein
VVDGMVGGKEEEKGSKVVCCLCIWLARSTRTVLIWLSLCTGVVSFLY